MGTPVPSTFMRTNSILTSLFSDKIIKHMLYKASRVTYFTSFELVTSTMVFNLRLHSYLQNE